MGQCSGATNSTERQPIFAAGSARAATDIGLKHQWTTDCLMRPLRAT
jgi:hypothetical protein